MSDAIHLERRAVPDGTVAVPGDKSLTHRAILLGALAEGVSRIDSPLDAADTRASAAVARALGARVAWREGQGATVEGHGASGLTEPSQLLDCGNSGTTLRLAAGMATGLPAGALTVLTGDASLRARPMRRVVDPLARLGAQAWTRAAGTPPVAVRGGGVTGGAVETAVPSAQVKSALLLAGLLGRGPVRVAERVATRDHTERMLAAMGARLERSGLATTVFPGPLRPLAHRIPGDPSSAANWWVLAAITGGRLVTPHVLLNPARIGLLAVLRQAGAEVHAEVEDEVPEPVGTVAVAHRGPLSPIRWDPADVPTLVDEVPLAALLATQAHGRSRLDGLSELRVKETDRLHEVARGLSLLGAQVVEHADALEILGPTPLRGAALDSHGDHRLAFVWAIAAAIAEGGVDLRGAAAVSVSYPGFWEALAGTGAVAVSQVPSAAAAGPSEQTGKIGEA